MRCSAVLHPSSYATDLLQLFKFLIWLYIFLSENMSGIVSVKVNVLFYGFKNRVKHKSPLIWNSASLVLGDPLQILCGNVENPLCVVMGHTCSRVETTCQSCALAQIHPCLYSYIIEMGLSFFFHQ